ncbi:MAG: YidC/Oxa1 family membrane protein insertase, partial [Synergistaceae bacterium]|nr:YidC/Oxa1 family membrane protein insertase [Synergistaceae bacterium]
KDDKESLNREMMALYKENKVNPAAGCLPLLVQLPVFILLYQVLTNYDFSGVSFLWIRLDGSVLTTLGEALKLTVEKDQLGIMTVLYGLMANPYALLNVSVYLPNLLLLLGIGFLTWYQQQLTASGNPQMAMMNWFMPLFLTFICLSLPGGVLLYWGVSSLLGVVQQLSMSRKTKAEMQQKPVLFKDKPTRSGD